MPKPEEIALVIANGVRLDTWESITVEGQFAVAGDGIARTMTLQVAEIGDRSQGWTTLRLKPGDTAQGYLAGRQAISGTVAVRQVAYNATTHGVQIVVISRAQNTVPSTVDANPGQYTNANLQQIATTVFGKVGVGFRIEGSPAGVSKIFERVSEHVGESRFGFIERLCRWRNLFMRDDENGDIVATRGGPGGGTIAQLVEGKNILVGRIVMDNHEAVDQINITTQNFGSDRHWGDDARDIVGSANVNGLPGMGRTVKDVGEQPGDVGDAQMRAEHEANVNAIPHIDAQITVPGWLMDDGTLWLDHLGSDVTIFSPMLIPWDQITLKLKSVRHMQDNENGTRTELNLCLPNGLGGNAPQVNMFGAA